MDILNFTDSTGKVITLFDGKMTLGQVVIILLAVFAVFFILRLCKGVIKFVFTAVVVVVALVWAGVVSPDQLKDVGDKLAQAGTEAYEKFAEASDAVQIEGGDVQINLEGDWVSVSDIKSIIKNGDSATVITEDGEYVTEDTVILDLLGTFK